MFSPTLRRHRHWLVSVPSLEASPVLNAFESYSYSKASIYFPDDDLAFALLTGTELSALSAEALVVKLERCFSLAKDVGIVYFDDSGTRASSSSSCTSWAELQVQLFDSFHKSKSLSSGSSGPFSLRLNEPQDLVGLLETFLQAYRKRKNKTPTTPPVEDASKNLSKSFSLLQHATTNASGLMNRHHALLLTDHFGSLNEFARAGGEQGWEQLRLLLGEEEMQEISSIVDFWERNWEDD